MPLLSEKHVFPDGILTGELASTDRHSEILDARQEFKVVEVRVEEFKAQSMMVKVCHQAMLESVARAKAFLRLKKKSVSRKRASQIRSLHG
ncbi:hypothetical protein AMTR_s00037p00238360 [Amborella trichopoda]|uniref:Uncharacterized protein n=1 Tax=Amborella trichopoda TaxID=13333 RepID=U5CVU8_AMBTC|nr:hypothetical protein AMTR_s00037p00238360 [Amborella trichopoda]